MFKILRNQGRVCKVPSEVNCQVVLVGTPKDRLYQWGPKLLHNADVSKEK